jgi:diguanylate cyclase (GGDEF)-like protein
VRIHRLRIVVLALLAIVVVTISASRVMAEARSSIAAEIQASERLVAVERAEALGDSLRAARQRIAVSASYEVLRLGIEGRESALLAAALEQAGRSPGVTGGAITDAAGDVLAQAGRDVDLTRSTDLRFRSGDGRHSATVTVAMPIRTPAGAVVGWLHQEFDIAGLVPQFARPIPYVAGAASLVRRDGVVLLTTAAQSGPRIVTPKLLALVRQGRVASAGYHSEILGADRVAAVAPVPGTRYLVLASADRAAASEPASALVWRLAVILVVTVALVVLLAAVAGYLLVRSRRALIADHQAVEVLASTDPLTALGNRRAFDAAVAEAMDRDGTTAVVLVDLDHLKALNDTLGHLAGDDGLRLTAEALRAAVRPGDVISRVGGDEFAVLLPDTDLPQAVEVAARIEAAIGDRRLASFGRLSASTGTAAGPSSVLPDTVERADAELYEAKDRRRSLGADVPTGRQG